MRKSSVDEPMLDQPSMEEKERQGINTLEVGGLQLVHDPELSRHLKANEKSKQMKPPTEVTHEAVGREKDTQKRE